MVQKLKAVLPDQRIHNAVNWVWSQAGYPFGCCRWQAQATETQGSMITIR